MADSTSPFAVQPPFDSPSFGDCILRSQDGVEFKVVRIILSMASSIFKDMFDMPTGASNHAENTGAENATALPVITVGEDAETLQALLQMIYPVAPPPIHSITLAQKLATACDKYFVDKGKLQLYVRAILSHEDSLQTDPMACYALAWRLGMEQEAVASSRFLQSLDVTDRAAAKRIVSESGDWEALLALWDLRLRTEKALDDILSIAPVNHDMACSLHPWACGNSGPYPRRREALRAKMTQPNPVCGDIEQFLDFRAGTGNRDCGDCGTKKSASLNLATDMVAEVMKSYPRAIRGFS